MAIYVTGDLHGSAQIHRFSTKNFPLGTTLTKDDYIIVVGDFGLVWCDSAEELWWRDWLENRPWTTLFIDGNHENHAALAEFPERRWNGGRIHELSPSVLHLMRGQVFELDGQRIFTMGGATSIDRKARVEGVSWWKEELPTQAELEEAHVSLDACDWKVDYVLTHCCASSLLRRVYPDGNIWQGPDELTDWLDILEHHLSFKLWYFGHHHKDMALEPAHRLIYHDIVRLGETHPVEHHTLRAETSWDSEASVPHWLQSQRNNTQQTDKSTV
ncbi:MAG: metallophosphoesterase [Atopobiaceae bacterium]|nr:metallophosphoesterase [Atopobiaceae bacterium]